MSRYTCRVVSTLAAVLLSLSVQADTFLDPLDRPALKTERAQSSLMLSTAKAGDRLVAVGEYGRIIISNDDGGTWQQVSSPVSVDLVSVSFPTDAMGWASGHAGVILHSADGGMTWEKQIDGREVETLMRDYYQQRLEAGDESVESLLRDVELNFQNGPELPFLGVWFRNELEGFAVGGFGMILSTRDGGKNWTPWLDRIDNPDVLHLNAVNGVDDDVFIAGERGVVWKLDSESRQTGYAGSFFGVTGDASNVIAFGLRGNAYRSTDEGDNWHSLSLPTRASINGAVLSPEGILALVTQSGHVVVGDINNLDFTASRVRRPALLTSVVPVDYQTIVVAGTNGMQRETLSADLRQSPQADEEKR